MILRQFYVQTGENTASIMNMFTEHIQQNSRTLSKNATRLKVLTAAGELFETTGYADTSIRTIAKRAGVSVGTVMSVGEKRALLVQSISHNIAKIHDELRTQPPGDLISVINPFLEMFAGHSELSRAYASSLIELGDQGQELKRLEQLLTEEILRRLAASTLTEVESRELAGVLYHAYLGLLIGWSAGRYSSQELKDQARTIVNHLENAFGVQL